MFYDLGDRVLISKTISILRNEKTDAESFRYALKRLGRQIAFVIADTLKTSEKKVKTPLGLATYHELSDEITIIGILRAALPMTEGMASEFMEAHIGFISASRGKMIDQNGRKFEIDTSYTKLPHIENHVVIIVDPMLASGSTLLYVLEKVRRKRPKRIIVACAIAATYGIERIEKAFPDVEIFAGAIDRILNEKGYIVPGLGDAGDRAFNTFY
jgi:uracil phosphoribosyltransferase